MTTAHPSDLPDGRMSRREWVRHTAIAGTVVAAGAGLVACDASTPASSPQTSAPAPPVTRGSAPGTASSAGPGSAPATAGTTSGATRTSSSAVVSDGGPPALVVGKTSGVPVGGGVVYPKHGVVVTQPKSGTFKCFSSSCTHLGCTVNKVAAGLIQCPCHGARFSITDGSVKAGPAPRPLPAQKFTIVDGAVVLD